jgi:hypothetical protein
VPPQTARARRLQIRDLIRPLCIAGILTIGWAAAALELLDEQTEQLLVEAVEAAYELDLYNNRCRGDRSGRRLENLNKELVSRFRMTALDVQDDLFPERYYRDAQGRMERDFLERLRAMGGCAGAKEKRLRDELRERYESAMAEIAELP